MTVTRTTTWVDGNTLTASNLNGEFNNLLNAPAIMNADISGGAAISLSKLAGSAQGAVAYDTGSSITTLAPGTSGQFLQTQGASANPTWASLPTNQVKGPTSGLLLQSGVTTFTGNGSNNGPQTSASFSQSFSSTTGLTVVMTMVADQTHTISYLGIPSIVTLATGSFTFIVNLPSGAWNNGVTFSLYWVALGPS
jgi:hypothetical protein